MGAMDALREDSGVLENLQLRNAPAWLIEGQVEAIRSLTSRLESAEGLNSKLQNMSRNSLK